MSESEARSFGLFAFPISDPPLKFHRFLYEYGHQLGRAGGDIIHWRPIGDPAQSDDEYRKLRTATLEKRDQKDSEIFKEEVRRLGNKDWLCQGEYQKYAKILGVEDIESPFVVFTAKQLKEKAILKFEPKVFDRPEWTRKLANIFIENLSAKEFSDLRKDGFFTDAKMAQVQHYLWKVGLAIYKIYERKARKLLDSLKVNLIPSLSSIPVDPQLDTKMRYWLLQDGSLAVDTETRGKPDGKVDFPLYRSKATNQQKLMMLLIHNHPNNVSLGRVIREIYPELSSILGGNEKEIGALINRVRALVTAIRKKLKAGGIPKEILPSVKFDADKNYKLRLNVAEVRQVEKKYKGKYDLPYVDTKLPNSNLHKDI